MYVMIDINSTVKHVFSIPSFFPSEDREREAEAYSNPLPPEHTSHMDDSYEEDDRFVK